MFVRLPRLPWPVLGADPEAWPSLEKTRADGIVAIGGDLKPERLLGAYKRGIFPWYNEGQPILWHSPDPRFVLVPKELHVAKSLAKTLKKRPYRVTLDTSFEEIIDGCATTERPHQHGTWITRDMREAYLRLHDQGFAHSVEAWADGKVVGGLYGVSLGGAFYGESMFARAPDASKVAFATLVRQLEAWGFLVIDCQQQTHHLERFGARLWPRSLFFRELTRALAAPTRRGRWSFDAAFA
jgi:leucyl/phenylalanyl-tRNA---protein transferase